MADFGAQFRAFNAKALARVDQVVQDITVDVATSLVEKSPVEFGTLRANWHFATEPSDTPDEDAKDPSGSSTISLLTGIIRETPAGGTTYVLNSLPYARVIEYGMYPNPPKHPTGKTVNGFSTQAPAGMRDVTLLEVPAYVQAATAKT